jgi:hypothetical protein
LDKSHQKERKIKTTSPDDNFSSLFDEFEAGKGGMAPMEFMSFYVEF